VPGTKVGGDVGDTVGPAVGVGGAGVGGGVGPFGSATSNGLGTSLPTEKSKSVTWVRPHSVIL
jgi:hypothetical protein